MRGTNQGSISSRVRAFAFAPLLVVWLLCAFATAARGDALAKPTNPIAREHLVAGNRLYRVREFEKAIEEYKAGALRESVPVFHFNLGQCYRQLGRHEEALWHYERFLERGKPTGDFERVTREFIEQMRSEIEKKSPSPAPAEPATNAGRPAVQARMPEAPPSVQPSVQVQSGPARRDGMPARRKIAIALAASGASAVALGVVLVLRAERYEADAAEICPMEMCTRAGEANDLLDRGKTQAVYANIALGAGAAMISGAAVLWITGSAGKHRSTAVAPLVSRTFAGFTASLRF